MFVPNYKNIVDAVKNITPERTPLYEHIISPLVMEEVLGIKFAHLENGSREEKKIFFKHYCDFFLKMGYDTVSYEQCITKILPGGGALYVHSDPVIKTCEDFLAYPFDELPDRFMEKFSEDYELLGEAMPEGMRAIGGAGNGIFEIVQDLVGYEPLCYLLYDDMDMVRELFNKVTEVSMEIWKRLLTKYGDLFCVARFGDDLGYQNQTLLPEEVIRECILPNYKKLVELIHSFDKPFLLHSCGCIFNLMEELIEDVKIDAKHSNEDNIAPFPVWCERYGDRIGNFGGMDTDVVCTKSPEYIKEYVQNIFEKCADCGGFAFGSGNSIPEYVPAEGYLAMVNAANEIRFK